MKTLFLFLFLLMFALSCRQQKISAERIVDLGSGKTATVYIDEEIVDGERLMVVDLRSGERIFKTREVNERIQRVWDQLKKDAERFGFRNALIKYRYPSVKDAEGEKAVYTGLLFEAELKENGAWRLRKVN